MKVQCPICHRCCHKINEKFNPDVHPNGSMIDLLDPWKTYGWGKFGEYDYGGSAVMWSDMLCPLCQAQLAPNGRLTLVSDDWDEVPKPLTLEQKNQAMIESLTELNSVFETPSIISLPQEEADAEPIDQAGEPGGKPTPPSPFICDICGWAGKTDASLKRHKTMKRHN
jgi:hypothetical protein